MSAIDDLLSELRACVTDKQDAPYLRAPELALLVAHIDGLEAELGQQSQIMREQGAELRGAEQDAYDSWCVAQAGPS